MFSLSILFLICLMICACCFHACKALCKEFFLPRMPVRYDSEEQRIADEMYQPITQTPLTTTASTKQTNIQTFTIVEPVSLVSSKVNRQVPAPSAPSSLNVNSNTRDTTFAFDRNVSTPLSSQGQFSQPVTSENLTPTSGPTDRQASPIPRTPVHYNSEEQKIEDEMYQIITQGTGSRAQQLAASNTRQANVETFTIDERDQLVPSRENH